MSALILYIIKSSICLIFGYIFYRILLSNETNYKLNRWFLISVLFFSILLPFNKFSLNYSIFPQDHEITYNNFEDMKVESMDNQEELTISEDRSSVTTTKSNIKVKDIALAVYIFISVVLLIRLLISVGYIIHIILVGTKIKVEKNIKIIYNEKINNTFTFFNYIVLNPTHKSKEEIKQIIRHESLHAKQLHSVDLLFSGIMTVVFWFNPVVWIINKSLQQIHEYLADKNVLDNGTNVVEYQKMLLSIITEEKLLGLSSSFNQSQIKKRLAMMTKMPTQQTKLKIIWAIPMVALVFIVLSAFNPIKDKSKEINELTPLKNEVQNVKLEKPDESEILEIEVNKTETEKPVKITTEKVILQQEEKKSEKEITKEEKNNNTKVLAVVPTRMNVFYCGVDNPVDIAVSGVPAENLRVEITNGTIEGKNGYYITRPRRRGNCILTIYNIDEKIGEKIFRVIRPEPIAKVAGKKSGVISKKELLKQDRIEVVMENINFDIQFRVIEFRVSATIEGFVKEESTKGNTFTKEQKDIIQSQEVNNKIYIEQIKAVGPDGITRDLPALVFILTE